ncbi:MAG: HD domain-containing phosphohydrolase [Rubrobacteraceae bacterium]
METEKDSIGRSVWFRVAMASFVVALSYGAAVMIVAATTGFNLTYVSGAVPLFLLAATGLVALLGWWRERSVGATVAADARGERERLQGELRERDERLRQASADLDAAREGEQSQRDGRQQLEGRLKEIQRRLSRERYLRGRSERAHQAEKEWRNELHKEVMRLSQERGALGDPSNVPAIVLRLARTLVGAEKGLLLSRRDEDADGKLDLLASEGFDNDPQDSAIVQRFADQVLERDRTVREENPKQEGHGANVRVDNEIDNLVAIPIYLEDEFSGVLVCANNPEGFEEYDDEVLLAMGDQAGAALQNSRLQGELRASYLSTIGVLAEAIEVKDPLLRGHSEEVSGYVASVANRLGVPPSDREELVYASLLHDIGKIGVSERILLKPAELVPEERAIVELHPRIGYRLIQQVPALRPIAPIILHHHERFDGGGYPAGLRGEQIPLGARIISVADSFSAMVSERSYHTSMTPEEACREFERCAGMQFDPEIVKVFVEEVRRNPPSLEKEVSDVGDAELKALLRGPKTVLGQGSLAMIDNLTLLYTRRHLHESARAEARRYALHGRPFSVILAELTSVKEVNDLLGYAAGDEEIQAAARILEQVAARLGGTGYRYGGSRLAVLVPGLDETLANLLADEIFRDLPDSTRPRVAAATYLSGESGDAVIGRARFNLITA